MTQWEILTQIKETLAVLPGIASCQIGLEANITPSDYPLIRIVPTRLTPEDDVGHDATLVIDGQGKGPLPDALRLVQGFRWGSAR